MTGFDEATVAAAFDVAALPGLLTGRTPALPIPVTVKRFQCPHCRYRRSKKTTVAVHIGRCWRNPDAHGCLTCAHYNEGEYGEPEVGLPGCGPWCDKGVSLEGRPVCADCGGFGSTIDRDAFGVSECGTCGGDGGEVKAGPIVHCGQWEAA